MDTLRVFIRWLGTIAGVDLNLHHKVRSPNYTKGEHARDVMVDSETVENMLAHLRKYEYATRSHVVIEFLRHAMLRRGSGRSLDTGDYDREDKFLALVHRPETGTPIKNGGSGERLRAVGQALSPARRLASRPPAGYH